MSSELSWVVHIKITRVVIWIVTRHRVSSLRCEPLRRSATRADVYPLNIDPPERALHIIWGSLASCGHARRDLPRELTRQLCYLNTYDRWSFHRFLAVPRNRQNRRFLVLFDTLPKTLKNSVFLTLAILLNLLLLNASLMLLSTPRRALFYKIFTFWSFVKTEKVFLSFLQ